jgi:hypothetical protein
MMTSHYYQITNQTTNIFLTQFYISITLVILQTYQQIIKKFSYQLLKTHSYSKIIQNFIKSKISKKLNFQKIRLKFTKFALNFALKFKH